MHGTQRCGLAVMKHRFTTTLEKCSIDIRGVHGAKSFTETSSHATDTATDFHHGKIRRRAVYKPKEPQVSLHLFVTTRRK